VATSSFHTYKSKTSKTLWICNITSNIRRSFYTFPPTFEKFRCVLNSSNVHVSNFFLKPTFKMSRDSVVGIATNYGQDDRVVGV
jgi:hypothetical protein